MRVVLLHHYYTSESRCDKNQEIEVMFMENRMKKNGIEYVLAGEYYIPDLKLPAEERPIGKYGRMHRDYLMEHNPMRFDDLVMEGQLWTYLAELNEQAQSRLQLIISQMQEVESVTERLKEKNQWLWIQSMNSIHNRAEEIVLNEIVYR
jgi:hypothetical protein